MCPQEVLSSSVEVKSAGLIELVGKSDFDCCCTLLTAVFGKTISVQERGHTITVIISSKEYKENNLRHRKCDLIASGSS
jgi:hypothetical protein